MLNDEIRHAEWLDALAALPVAGRLTVSSFAAGQEVVHEGEQGDFFLIVTSGEADVYREGQLIATVGPGSVIGELSLLTGARRTTTVRAKTALHCSKGSGDDFAELLECDAIREHFTNLAATRLAGNASAVPFTTSVGFEGELRPLLPSDREAYMALLGKLSPKSRRLRFFSAAPPTERMINYFLDLDFIDHFAWVVLDRSVTPHVGCGVARFIRNETDVHVAEAAFAVIDERHGMGIGTIMFGAIGVAAAAVGITTLTAEFLDENKAMRNVFKKADPTFKHVDREITQATMSVDVVRALLNPELEAALSASVHGIGLAAQTAGHHLWGNTA